jgi:hypothetical protein
MCIYINVHIYIHIIFSTIYVLPLGETFRYLKKDGSCSGAQISGMGSLKRIIPVSANTGAGVQVYMYMYIYIYIHI